MTRQSRIDVRGTDGMGEQSSIDARGADGMGEQSHQNADGTDGAGERPRYSLCPDREFTEEDRRLIWEKPASHRESEEERRICEEVSRNWNRGEMKIAMILLEGDAGSGKTQLAKALSAEFGLPYVKVTCFADMDKSDVIGAILPVVSEERLARMEPSDRQVWRALAAGDGDRSATAIVARALGIGEEQAVRAVRRLLEQETSERSETAVEYRFYPSEIVRAYRNGYLLEIQEPTVIRDAAVLMALNSALEPDGSLNLPTEIVRRHPDFVAVITTNRGYAGTRPLNEALRDRVQHAEKMDLPARDHMVERAAAKTGLGDPGALGTLADAIIVLDRTARAHAIKGVAGMRSLFFWADAIAGGASPKASLYTKVVYKITTDPDEIKLLEEALAKAGLLSALETLDSSDQLGSDEKKNDMTAMR